MKNNVWYLTAPDGRVVGASALSFDEGGAIRALNERALPYDVWNRLAELVLGDKGRSGRYEAAGYVLALGEVAANA